MTPAAAAVELDRLFRAWIDEIESVPFPVTTLEGLQT
jgi:hypothetical protein